MHSDEGSRIGVWGLGLRVWYVYECSCGTSTRPEHDIGNREVAAAAARSQTPSTPPKGPTTQIKGFSGPNTLIFMVFGPQNAVVWVLRPLEP